MPRIKEEEKCSKWNDDLSGCISDESSFYGDDEEKTELEREASSFTTQHYWKNIHHFAPAIIAERQHAMALQPNQSGTNVLMEDAPPLHDPYEGRPEFYQRKNETVRDFVSRLPPSTTDVSVHGPFLYVSNPHFRRQVTSPNIRDFRATGQDLLEGFVNRSAPPTSPGQARPRKNITTERQKLEVDIFECARQNGITEGKWMLFVSEKQVDEVWEAVVGATTKGNLGIQAKVAVKAFGDTRPRLIAVYTRDFADREDIRRVVVKLADMGFVGSNSGKGQIYYKCDAHTYLDIFAKNKWGIPPSMYSSGEMLKKG